MTARPLRVSLTGTLIALGARLLPFARLAACAPWLVVAILAASVFPPYERAAAAGETVGPVGDERQWADSGARLLAARDESCPDGTGGSLLARRQCYDEYDCEGTRVVLVRRDAEGRETLEVAVDEHEYSYSRLPVALACGVDRVTVASSSGQDCPGVRDFALDGRPVGPVVRVGAGEACWPWWQSVRDAGDGRFVAVRGNSLGGDDGSAPGYSVEALVFDRTGAVLAESLVAYDAVSLHPNVGVTDDGTLMVAWVRENSLRRGVFARLLDPHARPTSDIFRLDTFPYGALAEPVAAPSDDGSFRVLWTNHARGGLVGRTFVTHETTLATTTTTSTTTTIANESPVPPLQARIELDVGRGSPQGLATDGRGTWMATLASWYEDGTQAFGIVRSTDGGRSWSRPLLLREGSAAAVANGGDTWVVSTVGYNGGSRCELRFLRSTDAGETWTESFHYGADEYYVDGLRCAGLQLKSDGNGGWLAVWTLRRSYYGDAASLDSIVALRSEDDATTWSEQEEVFTLVGEALGDASLTNAGRGRWMIAWAQAPDHAGPWSFVVSRSTPGPESWSEPREAARGVSRWAVPRIGWAGDSSWVAAWTTAPNDDTGYDADVFVSRSTDDGETWTAGVAAAAYATGDEANDSHPLLAATSDGRVLLAWTSHHDLGGAIDTDADLLAVRSEDAGATWTPAGVLGPNAEGDRAADHAIALAHARDDVWAALWTATPPDHWRGRVFFALTRDAACGDGIRAGAEQCDDQNTADGDGCDSNCTPTRCGNGIVSEGEECDDGNPWLDDYCSPDCRLTYCGDGVLNEAAEECDDHNRADDDDCRNDCTNARCGDGVANVLSEECDDGNWTDGDGCNSNCTTPRCGNAIIDEGEECDDGNESDRDYCLTICRQNRCGDGIPSGSWETCDDGNLIDGDGCDSSCMPTGCGSGVITGDEQCDDGNLDDGDECRADCTWARCGDGVVRSCHEYDFACLVNPAEQCDDGNLVDGDGCDSTCRPTGCGSGIVTDDEACDDGNDSEYDACLSDCTIAACGDGVVHAGFEECDDRNTDDGDGCSAECRFEGECGDPNGDGMVTATDARQVLLRTTDALARCPAAACDVNASGSIDASDALGTLRYAVGLYHETVCKRPVRIVLRLAAPERARVGAVQIALDYSSLPGRFIGEADLVHCTNEVDALVSFNHDPRRHELAAGWISVRGMNAPVDLASCIFERYGPRESLSFEVVVVDAADTELAEVAGVSVTAEER